MGLALVSSLVDLLFPPRCGLCHVIILEKQEKELCRSCRGQIKFIDRPLCSRCGFPFPFPSATERLCGPCISQERPFRYSRQLGYYQGRLLEAVHKFKYEKKVALAKPLGRMLARMVNSASLGTDHEAIVPVPLYLVRLKQREFNQSLLLAKVVGRLLNKPVDYQSLMRVRWTEPQVSLTFTARRKNVRGAFGVKRERKRAIAGRTLLLVDDVMTSGATLEECSRTLLKAGAKAVDAVAVARAVGEEFPASEEMLV